MTQTSASVRPYRPEDEQDVLQLLDSAGDQWPPVHSGVTQTEFLRWKLGPDDDSPAHIVSEVDGKLAGCILLTHVPVKVGDRTLMATGVVEGAVDESYRGRGIMRRLVRELVAGSKEEGSHLLLFQGRHSTMRKLVAELGVEKTRNTVEVLERPPFQGLRVPTTRLADSPIVVQEVEEFDARSDGLWLEASQAFELAVERRHEYLNRRYCDPRGGRFRIRFAFQGTKLLGYVVFCVANRTGYIADLMSLADRLDVVDALVRVALTEIDHASASSARCAIAKDHPYRRCLVDLGFVLEKRRVRLVPLVLRGGVVDWPHHAGARIHWTLGDTNAV